MAQVSGADEVVAQNPVRPIVIRIDNLSFHNDQSINTKTEMVVSGNSVDNRSFTQQVNKYDIRFELAKEMFAELNTNKQHVFYHVMDKLMSDLSVGHELTGVLMRHNVLVQTEYEKIMFATNTNSDKAALTLGFVSKKGSEKLGYFLLALFVSSQEHLIKVILKGLIDLNSQEEIVCIRNTLKEAENSLEAYQYVQQFLSQNK